jgi:hypothetical protein
VVSQLTLLGERVGVRASFQVPGEGELLSNYNSAEGGGYGKRLPLRKAL